MSNNRFQLEFLPNELLIELFKYFQTEDLFRIFYNLNFRFNYLIQSLIHLSYSTDKHDHLSYPYIRTLIINSIIIDKLHFFPNVRRLMLNYVTNDLISQLNTDTLPNLEHLSINHKVHPYHMLDLRNKIFSSTFPYLKSCYISRMNSFQSWTQTFSLRFLTLNDIDSSIYLSILSACPNLYFLKFKLSIKSKIQSNLVLHTNLKHLIINMNSDYWPWDDQIFEDYFLCIPNLEQFRISRSIGRDTTMINYLQYYDWLSSIITTSHLFLLDHFRFDLYFNRSCELIASNFEEICCDLKTRFLNIYQNSIDYCLRIF
jgi:hypothetical protein